MKSKILVIVKMADNNTTNKETHIFSSATDDINERLLKYGLDVLPSILKETKSVIAGSFPLQCILDETWVESDIDIFCKHLIVHEFIDEYLLSLESSKKVRIIRDSQYSGYHSITNYKINHNGNEIIIELITTNHYDVVRHLENDIDMDVCRVYFDGENVFSYTDSNKFENKQATFDQHRRTYGPGGNDSFVNHLTVEQHKHKRCSKYEKRGFEIQIVNNEHIMHLYQHPLYSDEQIPAPEEVYDTIIARLLDYNLGGIGKFLRENNHDSVMVGDFMLNCALDEHWENLTLLIYKRSVSADFIKFFTDNGYYYADLAYNIKRFYVLDSNYIGEPNKKHRNMKFPCITVTITDIDISALCQKPHLDLEKICYDGKRIFSYTSWGKIQRRIGYTRGGSGCIDACVEKYKDREIFITDDKNDIGAVVKSSRKR